MQPDVLTSSFLSLRDKLHHIALSYLRSDEDAKDALQDTWLKLKGKREMATSFEAKNKLVAALRNVCIDRLKKTKAIPIDQIGAGEEPQCEMETENLDNLEKLLQEDLTPLQKQIFNLFTHDGFDYEQIAERLSMSVEAVRMNMSRTRKKIRETYKELDR